MKGIEEIFGTYEDLQDLQGFLPPKLTVLGTFLGRFLLYLLRHKCSAFQKMSPGASQLLVLESNENLDPELEHMHISRFCYYRKDTWDSGGTYKSTRGT